MAAFDPSPSDMSISDTSVDADSWTPPERTPEEWAEFEAGLAASSMLDDALLEEALRAWSPPDERAELFDAWNRAESAMTQLFDAINRWDAADAYALDGARSPSAWLRANLTISGPHASRMLSRSRGLRANPCLRTALGDGSLSTDQVDQLLFVFTPARAAYVERDAAVVIDHVAPLTVKQTGVVAHHWAERVDAELATAFATNADGEAPASLSTATVSELRIAEILDGDAVLEGAFNAADAAVIHAALTAAHRLSTPSAASGDGRDDEAIEDGATAPSPVDPRTPAQQRADAFVLVARFFLDHHQSVTGTSIGRPHVQIAVDLNPLTTAHLTGRIDQPYSTASLDLATILQETCDCSVTRILTAGPSLVIDIGRETRVIPPTLRKAVTHRDKTCRHPGCDMPAAFTDVHHIHHWTNGGPTQQDNCVLLCRRHHTAIHKRGWTLTGNPNATLWFHSPTGSTYSSRPPNLTLPLPLLE